LGDNRYPMADIFIGIIPLGEVPEIACRAIAAHIVGCIGARTEILPSQGSPEYALDENRLQYDAARILATLECEPLPGSDKVIAILDLDIFVPIFTHVFGEAKQGGKVGLVSLHRLKANTAGAPVPTALFLERASKVALHELGHLFGLVHCMDKKCLMHFSENLKDLDRSPPYFCRYCETDLRDFMRRPLISSQSQERS